MKKLRKSRPEEFKQLTDSNNLPLDIYTREGRERPTPFGMPNSLVILGVKYDIRYHTKIYFRRKESERLNGCVLYAHQIIFIDPETSVHSMRKTLCHEVCHVHIYTAQKSGRLEKIPENTLETLCDLLGEGIVDLVANNRPLA
jgi:hypothetical protein